MTAVSASGFNAREYGDVLEYVRLNATGWKKVYVEHMKDPRGDYFLALFTDESLLSFSREVKVASIEYDPNGASRGFTQDAQGHFVKPDGTPLLTTVYTRWAFGRRRRRPTDPENTGSVTDDRTWEREINGIIDEIREAHGGQRLSIHEPIPVDELT